MEHREIKEYFYEFVFGFIFNDIENSIRAKANYIVALALLVYTEYIGGLITGDLGVQKKSKTNFNAALKYFEWKGNKKYYSNFEVKIKGSDKTLDVYEIFRCGMVHEYFSKGICIVHNNPQHPDCCVDNDVGIGWVGNQLRFHNNAYFRDFKHAVNKYYAELIEGTKKSNNFSTTIKKISNREIEEI